MHLIKYCVFTPQKKKTNFIILLSDNVTFLRNVSTCCQVIVGVPAIYLSYVKTIIPDNVEVAAQNCWKSPKGAFTGKCGLS